jgi:excisionase family DNA binding protein
MTITPTTPSRSQATIESLAVSPKTACRLLDCSKTFLQSLLDRSELQSYRDGGSRRIITASIRAYIERRLMANAPARRGRPRKIAHHNSNTQ